MVAAGLASPLIDADEWLTPLATIDAAPDPASLVPRPGRRDVYEH